jgi:hypothetical protein
MGLVEEDLKPSFKVKIYDDGSSRGIGRAGDGRALLAEAGETRRSDTV